EGNIIIRPSGIALSPDEKKILIAGNSRVIILDRSDRTYKVFGGFGTKDGQLMSTNSIAVDSSGNIFVTDGYLNRIQKFSPEGNFIKKWGGIGTDIGQFNEPRGIIVDHDGYVYVSDTRNHRIQKFSNDGTYITQWVSDALINLSIDQENNIYAVGNNDVYKYSSDGLFLLKLSDIISGGGILRNPIAISISLSGDIFVLEAYGTEKCIQKIYSDGTFITKWCWTLGESIGPGQIVTDSSSNVFVADIGNNRVLKYSSDGKLIVEYGANSSSSDTFFNPKGIAVYNDRNVYVADYENDRILVFSTAGTLLNEWGSKGTGEGQFYNPNGISFDQNGFLFVADSGNARIEKFTDQGAFISQWGSQGSGDGEFSNPVGIGVNTAGEIFISDSGNSRIQKFSNNGIFQLKWTTENPSKGNIVDGNGNILSISAPYRITKYSQDGTILTTLGTQENPTSITGDQNDNYYVGQQGLSRTFITKYSNSGEQ
ncbi:MAG: 6-bladed beta-propeller, partial [Bacillota bacterium]